MSLLDVIRDTAGKLNEIADQLEAKGVLPGVVTPAHPASEPGSDSSPTPAQPEPVIDPTTGEPEAPTVGSTVADAAPGGPDAEPPSPAEPAADELPGVPYAPPDEAQAAADAEAADAASAEPPTIGSSVVDAAPVPPAPGEGEFGAVSDADADKQLDVYTDEQLTDELARRQHAAIDVADEQRTTLTVDDAPYTPPASTEGHA